MNADEGRDEIEAECPSCGVPLSEVEVEVEPEVVACGRCDARLDAELSAYLAFVQVCRD